MATSIITTKAREKMMKARAGVTAMASIKGIAFGDGGVNSSGTPTDIAENATSLTHEILRVPYQSKEYPSSTSCRYTYTLDSTQLVGSKISEIGLYDEDGDIVCIKHFLAKGKDADLEVTFQIDDEF